MWTAWLIFDITAVLQATDIAPYESTSQPIREQSSNSTSSSQPAQKRKYSDVKQESDVEEDENESEEVLLEKLASFQSSFQAEMEKLRNEINQVRAKKADKRSKKKVKEEPKAYFVPGEVIDLTWDRFRMHLANCLSQVTLIFAAQ